MEAVNAVIGELFASEVMGRESTPSSTKPSGDHTSKEDEKTGAQEEEVAFDWSTGDKLIPQIHR